MAQPTMPADVEHDGEIEEAAHVGTYVMHPETIRVNSRST